MKHVWSENFSKSIETERIIRHATKLPNHPRVWTATKPNNWRHIQVSKLTSSPQTKRLIWKTESRLYLAKIWKQSSPESRQRPKQILQRTIIIRKTMKYLRTSDSFAEIEKSWKRKKNTKRNDRTFAFERLNNNRQLKHRQWRFSRDAVKIKDSESDYRKYPKANHLQKKRKLYDVSEHFYIRQTK